MFDPYEKQIRKALIGLSRQRVRFVMQPGNVFVMDLVPKRHKDTDAILLTCLMRGWVEVLQEGVPAGQLTPDMTLPSGPMFTETITHYRLTDGGWNAINRAHKWTMFGGYVGFLGLLIAVLSWLAVTPRLPSSAGAKADPTPSATAPLCPKPQERQSHCLERDTFSVPYRC